MPRDISAHISAHMHLRSHLGSHRLLALATRPVHAVLSIDEARAWCDLRGECAGFTLHVAVPPSRIASRTDALNARAWVQFSTARSLLYSPVAEVGALDGGWVSYTKLLGATARPAGRAANVGADPSSPPSWLLQPGFVIAPEPTEEELASGSAQLLRTDEFAALHDVLDWSAASEACEGLTHALPAAGLPTDRLQAACYCCRVDVRTSRSQQSWTKWAPPARRGSRRPAEAGADDGEQPPPAERGARGGEARVEGGYYDTPYDDDGFVSRYDDDGVVEDVAAAEQAEVEVEDGEEADEDGGQVDEEEQQDAPAASSAYDAGGIGVGIGAFSAELGYFADGTELRAGFTSLERASAWCLRRVTCHCFTAKAPQAGDKAALVLYFTFFASAGGQMVHHADWVTWTRRNPGATEQGLADGAAATRKEEL